GGEERAEQPRQRQMNVARGETAGDAAGERQGNRERRGGALRHLLEGGYSMHGPIAVVTGARAQIHCGGRAARIPCVRTFATLRPAKAGRSGGFVRRRSGRCAARNLLVRNGAAALS